MLIASFIVSILFLVCILGTYILGRWAAPSPGVFILGYVVCVIVGVALSTLNIIAFSLS